MESGSLQAVSGSFGLVSKLVGNHTYGQRSKDSYVLRAPAVSFCHRTAFNMLCFFPKRTGIMELLFFLVHVC
jgi:hypothetical protein